jgi:hypothetical protein
VTRQVGSGTCTVCHQAPYCAQCHDEPVLPEQAPDQVTPIGPTGLSTPRERLLGRGALLADRWRI